MFSATESWTDLKEMARESKAREKQYIVLSVDVFKDLGRRMQAMGGTDTFRYMDIQWKKYPDGTDNIKVQGFEPRNLIAGSDIIFLASFHSNDVTLSQFSVWVMLLQSFISSLTIVLPFYPVGTQDRVDEEGRVAAANTYSMLLSSLPSIGRPIRLMIYDIHALQNRFYFHSSCLPSLHSAIPLLFARLKKTTINAVAFPDEGAAKRFGKMFTSAGFDVIVCGKVRDGERRIVKINEGDPSNRDIIVVDYLVQTGGTLYECGQALKELGATSVSAFVSHAVFPNASWKSFDKASGGDRAIFDKILVTNSIPTTQFPPDSTTFEVLDLLPQILEDLRL